MNSKIPTRNNSRSKHRSPTPSRPPSLADLQKWFSESVTGRHTGAGATADLSDWISANARRADRPDVDPLDSESAMDVYREAYEARLGLALKADFPAVHRFLGDRGFVRAVRNLLSAHPSRSPNLGDISSAFPKHLTAFWQLPFLKDLAALEWRIVQAFQAALPRIPDPSSFEALSSLSEDDWLGLRIHPAPSLRVMRSEWDVVGAWQSARGAPPSGDDSEEVEVHEAAVFLAIHRLPPWAGPSAGAHDVTPVSDTDVRIVRLATWEYRMLKSLKSGQTLGQALSAALDPDAGVEASADRAREVMERFRTWILSGILNTIDLSTHGKD